MVGPVENHYFSIQIDLSAIYRPRVGASLGFQAIIIIAFHNEVHYMTGNWSSHQGIFSPCDEFFLVIVSKSEQ